MSLYFIGTSENEEVDSSRRGSLISFYFISSFWNDEFGSISDTCKNFMNENLLEPERFLYEAANIQMKSETKLNLNVLSPANIKWVLQN